MPLPAPVPGLVIRYGYLWQDEARRGREEGRKDRPCVIVLAVEEIAGQPVVTVAPVTHVAPGDAGTALEIPPPVKRRLRLDDERSWIVATEVNRFVWPGPDVRPTPSGGPAYGLLPEGFFLTFRERVMALAREGRVRLTRRTE